MQVKLIKFFENAYKPVTEGCKLGREKQEGKTAYISIYQTSWEAILLLAHFLGNEVPSAPRQAPSTGDSGGDESKHPKSMQNTPSPAHHVCLWDTFPFIINPGALRLTLQVWP